MKAYTKDDIELRPMLPMGGIQAQQTTAYSPLHQDISRRLIILDSKFIRAEKELRKVNEKLIDSTTDVILENKPLFDDQKQILQLLQKKVQKAYTIKDPLEKTRIFFELTREEGDIETLDNLSTTSGEYELNSLTTFSDWNEIANEINICVKKLSMTYELSSFTDRKMDINVDTNSLVDSSNKSWKKSVQLFVMKTVRYFSLQFKFRPKLTLFFIIFSIVVVSILMILFSSDNNEIITSIATSSPTISLTLSPSLLPTLSPTTSPTTLTISPTMKSSGSALFSFDIVDGTYGQLSNGYRIVKFLTPTGALRFSQNVQINVLLVGGGGSGGSIHSSSFEGAGGGGGGGVGIGTLLAPAGTWMNITVGAGGSSAVNNGTYGSNGGDTTFTIPEYNILEIAFGGGKGGKIGADGFEGGSGGGGSGFGEDHKGGKALKGKGQYLTYYGSGGGFASHLKKGGAGGGGASSVGADSINSNGGKGGDGISWSFTGSQLYGGGGGGGPSISSSSSGGSGGSGGGGAGGRSAVAGIPYTGGGGGGASGQGSVTFGGVGDGGNGGCGIAMIVWR